MNILHRDSHSVYSLNYHLILVTKYRRPCLYGEYETAIIETFDRLITNMGGDICEMETDSDHIHLLISLKPDTAMKEVVSTLKSVTTRTIKPKYMWHLSNFHRGTHFSLWSDSYYAATTGGVTIDVLKKYVQEQKSEYHQAKKKPNSSPSES